MAERALLMAAGLGTRLKPFTDVLPKPLVLVAGRPMISYALDVLEQAGIWEIMINVHHHADIMEQFIVRERKRRPTLRLEIQDERAELLDSGGGVRKAAAWLFASSPNALVFNSDSLMKPNIAALLQAHKAARAAGILCTVSVIESPDAGRRYGGFSVVGNKVTEHVSASPDNIGTFYHFPGLQVIEVSAIESLRNEPACFSIRDKLWKPLISEGRLGAWHYQGPYLDVGTLEDLQVAEQRIKSGQYKL